jgi:hypothetical protein
MSLDTVIWQPGWKALPQDEFRTQVADFLAENASWVIDGNYNAEVGDLTAAAATDIICMCLRIKHAPFNPSVGN